MSLVETALRPLFPDFDVRAVVVDPLPEPDPRELIEAERARVMHEARERGTRDGRTAALDEWRARLASLATAMEGAAAALTAERARLASELDRRLPAIVFGLVRKILGRELTRGTAGPEGIMRTLAAELAGGDDPLTLRVDPRAAAAFDAWRVEAQNLSAVRVEIDRSLGPGDWLVETRDALVDGRVESQLEEAWRRVVETDA